MMIKQFRTTTVFCGVLLLSLTGCDQQKAQEVAAEAEADAKKAADSMAKGAEEAAAKSEEVVKGMGDKAKEVGEKAMGFLKPLKEKLGNLESLKDKPEELKQAVSNLINTIEEKTADLNLPESVSNALAKTKEKLVAFKDYLDGEVEQAKIDERLKEISDSMKGSFTQ